MQKGNLTPALGTPKAGRWDCSGWWAGSAQQSQL